jgi:hypothetical protein
MESINKMFKCKKKRCRAMELTELRKTSFYKLIKEYEKE